MKDFKKLIVWQKGIDLFMQVNSLIKKIPREERFEIVAQLRRAALSIPSNISEGSACSSVLQYKIFLERSLGSAYEVETVLITLEKTYPDLFETELRICFGLVEEIQKMLIAFINKLKNG